GGSDSDQEPSSLVSIHTDGTVYEMEGSRIAVIEVRGKLIPLVRVAEVLGVQALFRDATQGIVVLVEAEGREVALLVDRVVGKQEVVIKPLGETFRRNDLFAGASLLSDGVLSLVLNILAIARHTSRLHDITERRAQEQRWLTSLEGGEIVI
ncbi:MAG TPA: chemotaxis protein CheW, partial [Candidatus Methylacidiphilales bacterium]|nr:chemotaxis protein CheW [Candidatus Methylacidiphilales bacterium]